MLKTTDDASAESTCAGVDGPPSSWHSACETVMPPSLVSVAKTVTVPDDGTEKASTGLSGATPGIAAIGVDGAPAPFALTASISTK